MTRPSDRSTVSEVHDLLKEFGPGAEITVKDVLHHMAWLEANHASAALGLLSQERYGMLERLGKDGRVRRYRITKEINNERRSNKRPAFARRKRGKKDDAQEFVREDHEPLPAQDVCRQASDLLLEAAMMVEKVDDDDDTFSLSQALQKVRQAFYLLKKGDPNFKFKVAGSNTGKRAA